MLARCFSSGYISPMAHEELHIRNLGPLKEIHLTDIRPIMIFVGESGSGKSLLLKTLAMMRHVTKKLLLRQAFHLNEVKSPFRLRTDSYLQYSGLQTLITSETEVEYGWTQEGQQKMEISLKGRKLVYPRKLALSASSIPYLKIGFIGDMRTLVPLWAQKGASFQSKILDNYFSETFSLWEDAIQSLERQKDFRMLGRGVQVRKGNDSRKHLLLTEKDGRTTFLERGATGEKSAIPLLSIARYLIQDFPLREAVKRNFLEQIIEEKQKADGTLDMKNVWGALSFVHLFLMIEEPELSLDPGSQVKLLEEFLELLKSSKTREGEPITVEAMFTTHSPYWIVALNTLLQEKNDVLRWDDLGGYWLQKDGKATELRNEEVELLETPNMDETTEELERRFQQALKQES